jgi:hypothetical protein
MTKAMMALNDELKLKQNRPVSNQALPSSGSNNHATNSTNINKNQIQPHNINYSLKEPSLNHRIGTALKRSSFDTDLPHNPSNKKPNTSHAQQHQHQHPPHHQGQGPRDGKSWFNHDLINPFVID